MIFNLTSYATLHTIITSSLRELYSIETFDETKTETTENNSDIEAVFRHCQVPGSQHISRHTILQPANPHYTGKRGYKMDRLNPKRKRLPPFVGG